MQSWKTPTREQVDKAVALLAYAGQYRYFFDRLENPEWLGPLRERGFFKHPPQAERNEEEGTIRFPPWPEARYLARMAKHRPELVAEIVREMPDTDNAAVHADLVEAALAMPPEISVQLAKKAKRWAEIHYPLPGLPEKLGRLIVHWAEGGKVKEAMCLARVLLGVLPDERRSSEREGPREFLPEPRARFEVWFYEKVLRTHYPELLRAAGRDALELLCDRLEEAIRLSLPRDQGEGPEDLSCGWRPAIEDHQQNLGHTLKDALVSGVRDAAEELVRSNRATVAEVVQALERRKWKVFRRIALHLLRLFPERAGALIAARLADRNLFEDVGVWHEYILLLRSQFGQLSEEDRREILGWVEEGPDAEELGGRPSEDALARYRECWQRDWLARIGPANLPPKWQERYRTLVAKYGEPEHPEFPVYSESGVVGPASPKTADELRAMSVEEIVAFLARWRPSRSVFGEPSPEGLGRTLASVVLESPRRFAAEAERFEGLDPTYVRALLFGLRDGLKQREAFDWKPVLRLCRWVMGQPREIPGRKVDRWEADPDWGLTRKAIAELLSSGLEGGDGEIPFELRQEVWSVLRPLTDDPEPTPEYEERYGRCGNSKVDSARLSFNTTRGEAMHALVRYALWVRRHLQEQANAEELLARGFDEMPEVREVLEAHLDVANDPSLAVRAVYGYWFPLLALLDPRWAEVQKDRIFPRDEGSRAYFGAAWNTYIAFRQPCDDVFDLLRDVYARAVERIGVPDEFTRWLGDPDKRLAEHLMVFYWRGRMALGDPLFVSFWRNATDALRAHAIGFIGRALQQTDGRISPQIAERLQCLWHERFSQASRAPGEHSRELSAFGWWFVSGKMDPDWSIARLLEALRLIPRSEPSHVVLEHLAQLVDAYPHEAVECLHRIVQGDREGWRLCASREHVRWILRAGLRHPEVRREAERVVHYLGSRGFLDYRDLLDEKRWEETR